MKNLFESIHHDFFNAIMLFDISENQKIWKAKLNTDVTYPVFIGKEKHRSRKVFPQFVE